MTPVTCRDLRRFARRTNAHSRKLSNHKACFALWVAWYNFVRINSAVEDDARDGVGTTNTIWTMRDLLTAIQLEWNAVKFRLKVLLSRLKERWFVILGIAAIAALHVHRDLTEHPELVERVILFCQSALLAVLWPSTTER